MAYAQKLLFPDGLILSLLLLFAGAIQRRRIYFAGLIAVLLVVVKVVFVSLFLVLAVIWLGRRGRPFSRRMALLMLPSGLGALWVAVFLTFPLVIYQTTVQIPTFLSASEDRKKVVSAVLHVRCGGRDFEIADPGVVERVREHSASVLAPIGSDLAQELNCSEQDVAALQRDIIILELKRDPVAQVLGLGDRVLRSAFVVPQTSHLRYMLTQKAALLNAYSGRFPEAHYDKLEIESFQSLGVVLPPAKPNWLLREGIRVDEAFSRFLTIVSSLILVGGLGLGLYQRSLFSEVLSLSTLGIAYNVMIGLSHLSTIGMFSSTISYGSVS